MTVTVSDRWYDDVDELLHELSEYFEGMADADQPAGVAVPIPNEEMRFLMDVERLQRDMPWPRDVPRKDGKEMG